MNASVNTGNEAYGIINKHDNIELQTNECYKSVPSAEPALAAPDEGLENTYTTIPSTTIGH